MTKHIQAMKCFRLRPTQVAFMVAAEDVNWSEVVRSAIDRKINKLIAAELKGTKNGR